MVEMLIRFEYLNHHPANRHHLAVAWLWGIYANYEL